MQRNRRSKNWPLALALYALLFNIAYPTGYMPGSISQGQWIVICPYGMPDGFFSTDDHQQHNDESEHEQDNGSACYIGVHQAAKTTVPEPPAFIVTNTCKVCFLSTQQTLTSKTTASYQTRAPPLINPS